MYKLYGVLFSNPVRRVFSLLEEAGLDYEFIPVDLAGGAQFKPEFLALNPNHQVPVLDDEGFILYESAAIMRYLCNKHDLDPWYPKDLHARAINDQWLDWCQCMMTPAVFNIVFNKVFAKGKGDLHLAEVGEKKLPDIWNVLDAQLQKTEYLTGDHMTIVDLSVYSNIFQLKFARIKPESEAINSWAEKIAALPGVIKSLPPRG
jgi:glutathione S-transferase